MTDKPDLHYRLTTQILIAIHQISYSYLTQSYGKKLLEDTVDKTAKEIFELFNEKEKILCFNCGKELFFKMQKEQLEEE